MPPDSIQVFSTIIGGLGLFFAGINLVSQNIKSCGETYTPSLLRSLTQSDIKSGLGGILAGALTSSGKSVTFTLAALSELGVFNLRKCLPIIMGGSIGSAFIVLWASLSLEYFIYALFALSGLCYQFGDMNRKRTRLIAGIALGFGLLFLGLQMIKTGAAPIKEFSWFESYIQATEGHWLLALLVGAILAFISQSGASVAIIAISLVNVGLLGYHEAIMLVFGTNIGSGLSTGLLGLGLSGLARQLVMFHSFFKIIGIIVLVPLLYIEVYAGIPLLTAMVSHLSSSTSMQIAGIYLLYEIITAITLLGLLNHIAHWFEYSRLSSVFHQPQRQQAKADKLNIILLYSEEKQAQALQPALRQYGIEVTTTLKALPEWQQQLPNDADVLLAHVSPQTEEDGRLMEQILKCRQFPVVLSEHDALARDSYHECSTSIESLVRKLYTLSNKKPRVAPVCQFPPSQPRPPSVSGHQEKKVSVL